MGVCRSPVIFNICSLFIVVSSLGMNESFYAVLVSMFMVIRNLGFTLFDMETFRNCLVVCLIIEYGHSAL
jgi:hypothetical protein